eukprot:3460203-Prymnesium_polylepis.2
MVTNRRRPGGLKRHAWVRVTAVPGFQPVTAPSRVQGKGIVLLTTLWLTVVSYKITNNLVPVSTPQVIKALNGVRVRAVAAGGAGTAWC